MKKIKNGISFSATEVELIASHQSMQIINLQPRPNGHLWSVFRNHQFMLMTIIRLIQTTKNKFRTLLL